MALRLHSRLVLWNLAILAVVSVLLSAVLSFSQLALVIFIAVAATVAISYSIRIIISRPLRDMAAAARGLAAGNLDQRVLMASDEDIAALSASLNTMAKNLSSKMHELSEGKQRLELILEAMGQGVMVLDRSCRITLTNSAMNKILGTDRDLAGRTPLEVFRRPEVDDAVRAVLNGVSGRVVEITAGNGRILEGTVAPVASLSGDVESVVAVFHDLTDIRRTERMRRDFVANVSHEFKTPLTSIRGYAETLLSGAKDDPKIATDFLRTIERNAEQLEALVSDLLVLARLEAELPASREAVDLKSLIDEQIAARKNTLHDLRIQVDLDCPAIEVQADRSRLSTALSNLIDNAISYNKPGGQIRISAEAQNGQLSLAIADTGNGIPSEELHRIFERFYRVDKARARDSGGTGLGLSIVKHAIESQGGSISVTSRVGVGSTFTIRLPL